MTFDPDFAGPSDWAEMYREHGLQVVPAMAPDEDKNGSWKRPAIAWRQHQNTIVDDATFAAWYGAAGLHARRSNMGLLTGKASSNVFVLDLDLHKTPQAAAWWSDILDTYHHSIEPKTVAQTTGGGGRQLFFRAPDDWLSPTNKTSMGVDIRGQGGFAMMPPSLHESGREYAWDAGKAPWQTQIAEAPPWLCDAIDSLVEQHGGTAHKTATERTGTPDDAMTPFGSYVDRREDVMTRHVWGWLVNLYRDCPIKPVGTTDLQQAFQSYVMKVQPRLYEPGASKDDLLERENRGISLFRSKWAIALDMWETKITEHAAIPSPTKREEPKPDNVVPFAGKATTEQPEPEKGLITLTPFKWISPHLIPPRDWLYGTEYIRKFLTLDISPGGVGKSSLVIAEALAMVTGKPLLGITPKGLFRVSYFNGEDPMEELSRRVMAAIQYFGLQESDIGNRLFLDTGREQPIVLGEQTRDGAMIFKPVVDAYIDTMKKNAIDVAIIDPFVSSHRVTENDNNAIDRISKQWSAIADECRASIKQVHHSRKTGGAEVTVEDARGAGALIAAARSARSLNQMSEEEATQIGIDNRRFYFRTDNGKANLAPPAESAHWYKLESVDLQNGNGISDSDKVGVVVPWKWPSPLDDITSDDVARILRMIASKPEHYRDSDKSDAWIGHLIADVLRLDLEGKHGKANRSKIAGCIKVWKQTGAIKVIDGKDEARKATVFIAVGEKAAGLY